MTASTDRGTGSTPGTQSKYDRQLIVALLDAPEDAPILDQATALNAKPRGRALPSEVVVERKARDAGHWDAAGIDALKHALAGKLEVPSPVTERSRVYLLGAGSAADRTLAGCSGEAIADLLAACGLKAAAMISVVADGAGRDPDRTEGNQADENQSSFASRLHRRLFEQHGIRTVVHARLGAVHVVSAADAAAAGGVIGRKLTGPGASEPADRHHATRSKLRFGWDGARQRCDWAY